MPAFYRLGFNGGVIVAIKKVPFAFLCANPGLKCLLPLSCLPCCVASILTILKFFTFVLLTAISWEFSQLHEFDKRTKFGVKQ